MTKKGNTMAGLTSLPQKKNIKGQPHKLAYITEAESDLLKSRGGAGKPVQGTKGVPAYFDAGEGMGGYGSGDANDATGGMGDPSEGVGGQDQDVAGYDIGFDAASQQAAAAAAAASTAEQDISVGSVDPGDTFGGPFDPGTPEFTGFGFPDVPTTAEGAVSSIQQAGKKEGKTF